MRLTSYLIVVVFLFSLALFYCAPAQKEEMDIAQVRQTIEEANVKFGTIVQQGDAEALAALYTEDATALPPDGEMIQGRQAIEALWNGVFQMGMKEVVLTTVDVFGTGDLAYEIGWADLKFQPEGQEPISQKAKYVVVWKKSADGTWKLHVDIWNAAPPAQR